MLEEPPETPAHLFAVKAFKTALFGTPAPNAHVQPIAKPPKTALEPSTSVPTKQPEAAKPSPIAAEKIDDTLTMQIKKADLAASPAKGILLTPGTVAARRKTVSFSEMASKHQKLAHPTQDDSQDHDGDDLFAIAPRSNPRRTLFQSTDESPTRKKRSEASRKDRSPSKTSATERTQSPRKRARQQESQSQASQDIDPHTDITIDLSQPRSRSGKHWMHEYQREHDASKVEMRNLIRHGKVTRSFAEKRDQEATDFAEKLAEAEAKLRDMEQRVSGLANQLMDAQTQDGKQEEILSELATQTAQALRYKGKAERYRAALWGEEDQKTKVQKKAGESREAVNAVRMEEISALRAEVASLKVARDDAKRQVSDLVLENADLKGNLMKVKNEVERLRFQESVRDDEGQKETVKYLREKLDKETDVKSRLNKKLWDVEEELRRMKESGLLAGSSRSPAKASATRRFHELLDSPKRRRPSTQDPLEKSRREPLLPFPPAAASLQGSMPGTEIPDLQGAAERRRGGPTLTLDFLGARDPSQRRAPISTIGQATPGRSSQMPASRRQDMLGKRAESWASPRNIAQQHSPAKAEESGRLSPIIPVWEKSHKGLRHTQSTSSLVPEHLPRRQEGSGLAIASVNGNAGNRAGRPELPPDRLEAAKKRLEEKAARRASRGTGKENERPTPAARGLSSYYDI